MAARMGLLAHIKAAVVGVIGRRRANVISAPFHQWLAVRRSRLFLAALPPTGLRVNVGCGWRPLAGWINLDRARGPRIDVVWDLRSGLPFHDATCEAILLEHVLEHLPRQAAESLLRECRRCLMRRGGLRVSLPDAEKFLRSYSGDRHFLLSEAFTTTIDAPIDRVNQMMREGGQHLWAYDAELLEILLRRAGFGSVGVVVFGESRFPAFVGIDNPARREESLYVDASYE